MIKGLRPILEGFVVQCTRARAKREVKSLTYCSQMPECIGTTKPDRSVFITIITRHFQTHPVNVSNINVKGAYVLEARAASRVPPIVTSRGAPKRRELSPHNTRRMKAVTLLLTALIAGIFHKQCQWLAWRLWRHALAFVTHEVIAGGHM